MQAEELYRLLQPQPFQPVRVHLQDGRMYDIWSREMAVVGLTYLDIGTQAPGFPEGIWASFVTVQLDEIRQVEPLPAGMVPLRVTVACGLGFPS
jgi:hypothetical protein